MVTPDMSSQDPSWWRDERYAIYDLNVNSAAVYPQHKETLDLATARPFYTAKGYAYAGGGRRITRVEISLDKGKCTSLNYQAHNLHPVESTAKILQHGA